MTTDLGPTEWLARIGSLLETAASELELDWHLLAQAPGDDPSWEAYATVLARLDTMLKLARKVRDEIEAIAAPLVPRVATAVEGVGLVEKHGSGKRTAWDVDALQSETAKIIGARLSDDRTVICDLETGELVPPSEIVRRATARTVEIMVQVCGMSPSKSWSATALKVLGIDPKDFKTSEWAGWKITVTPGIIDTTEGEAT